MFYLSIIFSEFHLSARVQITLQLTQAEGQSVETASPPQAMPLKARRQHPARGMTEPTN